MSIFQECDLPSIGDVSICERNTEIQTEKSGRKTKNISITDYVRIVLLSDLLHSPQNLTRDYKSRSAFVEEEEDIWQKSLSAWSSKGLLGILDELYNVDAVPIPIQKALLFSKNGIIKLQDKFHALLSTKLSNVEHVDDYSRMPNWTASPVKAFACHPLINRIAVGLEDDTVKIICVKSDFQLIVKDKRQKDVRCLAWRPLSAYHLAIGGQNGIYLWFLDPASLASRPNPSQLRILSHEGHSPVTEMSWSKHGYLLASASPKDSSIMIWNISNNESVALNRLDYGYGFLAWSPCGQKLLTCSTTSSFRVWDTINWNCEKWANLNGRCQVACWSKCGNILIFAVEDEACLYYVQFYDKGEENKIDIVGNGMAIKCCDLTQCSVPTSDGERDVGGLVKTMVWDPSGSRLAVVFRGDTPFGVQQQVAVFNTQMSPVFEISLSGFIGGQQEEFPMTVAFTESYEEGALLNVCWSSGVLSQIPLLFHRN